MWSKSRILAIIAPLVFHVDAVSHARRLPPEHSRALHGRNYITEATIADSYDFIVVGGGLAGLVIASRLTEDFNTTVLVLEAGESGDTVGDSINPPARTYYNSLIGTSYDWQHKTVPQDKAAGRVISWPRGKVLGGSAAINGMYYVRPSQIQVDTWKGMLEPSDDSAAWGWDNLLAGMKKSETFTSPSSDVQSLAKIQFNAASYGSNGPLHVSYPGFMFSVVGNWTPSLEAIGIESAADPANGKNFGGFVSTLSINPTNWTRSYSKSAYIDPLPPRKNLDILMSATVTRVVLGDKNSSGNVVASGVEFATSADSAEKVVKVNKEVVLTGGAPGSPRVLMHSGVGPKDVLDAAGVPLAVELPGVGQHLQDHLAAPVTWESKVQTGGDMHASGSDFSPLAMSFVNSAIAYINASILFDSSADFESNVASALDVSAKTLVPSQSSEVVEGYKAIYTATQKLTSQGAGQVELLLSINAPKAITIQAALQHPYKFAPPTPFLLNKLIRSATSQGRVYINSSSPFDPIVIDPQYFSHPADITLLREGIKLARRVGNSAPISNAFGAETVPGPDVSSDEQLDAWLAGVASTEFHPQATCAMLPRSQGGVVDAKLRVYGLANVRVADSSVFPLSFAAHLAAPTYGLAEKAAEFITDLYKVSANSGTTTAPDSASQTGGPGKNAASRICSSACTALALTAMFSFIVSVLSAL
ncbi:putative alcohol oxidase [Lyophyllum shimeji]|uniref:Alcohol oxidase n=1 Tax=Lyophyllum shimeji TaxID=47721 RepID=A0A9P3UQA2_LYOSH|nr:putative alcohol oxidase [Lyophyllum shimeji]